MPQLRVKVFHIHYDLSANNGQIIEEELNKWIQENSITKQDFVDFRSETKFITSGEGFTPQRIYHVIIIFYNK